MAGVYTITKKVDHDVKFACMVSFNFGTDQYYDMDLPDVSSLDVDEAAKTIESFIDLTLQAAADSAVSVESEVDAKTEIISSIEIVDGKAVIS